MKFSTIVVCVISSCAVVTTAGIVALSTSLDGTQTHSVRSKRGIPLARLIAPGQVSLVVEKDQPPPLWVAPPPGVGGLEWLTQLVDVVMLVRVESIIPELSPAEDWIKSTVRASVEEVLKATSLFAPTFPGDVVHFAQDSGELQIAGTRVRAILPWADSFEVGRRYLIFAGMTEDGQEYVVSPAGAYLVGVDHELLPLAKDGSVAVDRGVSLTKARTRIQAALKAKGKSP
jgi:hypothetical protein